MIAAYFVRLSVVCLASFFLLHLVFGLLLLQFFPWITRASAKLPSLWASRLSFALRLSPAFFSALAVLLVCLPSYLRYEGNAAPEEIGVPCLLLAFLGLTICLISVARGVHAVTRSSLLSHRLPALRGAETWCLNAKEDDVPSLALVGILRPRIVVSPRALDTLSAEQLQAALEHEKAHRLSSDNLKRLLMLVAPELFPFAHSFRGVEAHWERCAELSADDFAARGEPGCSIALAEALVKLARVKSRQAVPPLVSGLFAAHEDLSIRVERLLRLEPMAELSGLSQAVLWAGPILLSGVCALAFSRFEVFRAIYRLLESLLR